MFVRSSSATTATAFLAVMSAIDIVRVPMEATNWTVVSADETFMSLHLHRICIGQAYNQTRETQLMLTNRATHLEVTQGHQTLYHSICWVWYPTNVL